MDPGETRPRSRLHINFAVNLIGAVAPLAVAILSVPLYIEAIGETRYGMLALVWVLIGYFGFLDLGLSPATINAMAKISLSNQAERARVLVTSLVINSTMACVGGLALYIAGHYLIIDLFNVPAEIRGEVDASLPWIALLLPLTMIGSIGIGAIESRENFILANILQVGGQIFGQIVPVIFAIVVSPDLSVVIPAAALSRVCFVLVVICAIFLIEGPLRLRDFTPARARSILSYGGWITVSALVTPFLNTLDQLMIGRLSGLAQVTFYAVPMNIISRSQILTAAISRAVFPRLSSSSRDDATSISSRVLIVAAILYAGICAGGILLAEPLLTLWMGALFASVSTTTSIVLLCAAWINSLAFAPYALLQGQGRPDVTAKIHLLQVLPYVLLLWLLTTNLGIEGAALAFLIRAVLDLLVLLYSAGMRNLLRQLAYPAAVVALAVIAQVFMGHSWPIMFAVSALIPFAVVGLLYQLERQTFDLMLNAAYRLRRRGPAA